MIEAIFCSAPTPCTSVRTNIYSIWPHCRRCSVPDGREYYDGVNDVCVYVFLICVSIGCERWNVSVKRIWTPRMSNLCPISQSCMWTWWICWMGRVWLPCRWRWHKDARCQHRVAGFGVLMTVLFVHFLFCFVLLGTIIFNFNSIVSVELHVDAAIANCIICGEVYVTLDKKWNTTKHSYSLTHPGAQRTSLHKIVVGWMCFFFFGFHDVLHQNNECAPFDLGGKLDI